MTNHVHKFGGSSLADADCYRRVAHILLTHGHSDDLIVVSAAGKSTNALYKILELHKENLDYTFELQKLICFQQNLINQVLSADAAKILNCELQADTTEIEVILSTKILTIYQQNYIISFGERWSAKLLTSYLNDLGVMTTYVNSCAFLEAHDELGPIIDFKSSNIKLSQIITQHPDCRIVITGFICANKKGQTLLLGRNGSDYSATLVAALANVARVTIWTDVEGIFNADPNKLHDAKLLPSMSLLEANKLARLGSPILHARSLSPLFGTNISMAIRSSYTPDTVCTLITQTNHTSTPVVTSLDKIALLRFPTPDTKKLLSSMELLNIVPLAYWHSSKKGTLELAFTIEEQSIAIAFLKSLNIDPSINVSYGLVALVNTNIDIYQKSFAKLLSRDSYPLYKDKLSLVSITPSENISLLTQKVHRQCAGPTKQIGILLLGTGNIGRAWMQLFANTQVKFNADLEINIKLIGILNSKKALIDDNGIDPNKCDEFKLNSSAWNYESLFTKLKESSVDEIIALDITASQNIVDNYPLFFIQGIHMVSANKLAGSDHYENFSNLKQLLKQRRIFWRYNASCGAGLPIQHAINDLYNSGDEILSIGGIFSGTLCWLFEKFDGTKSFSQLVMDAKKLGITEPDPRDDLSGKDMQRKLLILAREVGLNMELDEIELESLIPIELRDVSVDEFLSKIELLDDNLLIAQKHALASKNVLRYVANLDVIQKKASVSLKQFTPDHPYANLTPGDNIFVINSKFYTQNPLIIRGPGAGREVTAAAIQSDLVQICKDLIQE